MAQATTTASPPRRTPNGVMRDYRCRECGTHLFRSDATEGREEITCPSRRCAKRQTVRLGED